MTDETILVIDDDEPLLRVIKLALVSAGFSVRTARDGLEALVAMESDEPALIVLDLQMPQMDGRTFFKEARARGHNAPVLVLSAYRADEAKVELGADGAVAKPFDPEDLVQEVARLLTSTSPAAIGGGE